MSWIRSAKCAVIFGNRDSWKARGELGATPVLINRVLVRYLTQEANEPDAKIPMGDRRAGTARGAADSICELAPRRPRVRAGRGPGDVPPAVQGGSAADRRARRTVAVHRVPEPGARHPPTSHTEHPNRGGR